MHQTWRILGEVSSGTIQATVLLGLAILVFVLQYLGPPARTVRASPTGSGPAPTRAPARYPLTYEPISVAAHQYFKEWPSVTLCIGTVLNTSAEALQLGNVSGNGLSIQRDVVKVCQEAANVSKVYILAQVPNDETEAIIRSALDASGLIGQNKSSQIPPHRLLVCSTEPGKIAIVRQIEPSLHLESDISVVAELERFHQNQKHLLPSPAKNSLLNLVSKPAH